MNFEGLSGKTEKKPPQKPKAKPLKSAILGAAMLVGGAVLGTPSNQRESSSADTNEQPAMSQRLEAPPFINERLAREREVREKALDELSKREKLVGLSLEQFEQLGKLETGERIASGDIGFDNEQTHLWEAFYERERTEEQFDAYLKGRRQAFKEAAEMARERNDKGKYAELIEFVKDDML